MTRLATWFDRLSPTQRRAMRDGLIVAGVIFNVTLLVFWLPRLYLWIDAEAWWHIDLANLYRGMDDPGQVGAFRYAPPIAWLFAPASWLSWPALVAVYLGLSAIALVAMTRRKAILFAVAFPPILLELLNGNVHLFMALAIWAGMRWPATWALILLTKVTPGVGVLWFAGRRDWRGLAIALGATAAIVILGFAIAPGQWVDWFRTMSIAAGAPSSPGVPPLMVRLPVAAALAFWSGRTGRAWLVPVATFVALPVLWIQGLAILTASFPLWWERDRWRRSASVPVEPEATAADRTDRRAAEGIAL
jgi:hypothetical protein